MSSPAAVSICFIMILSMATAEPSTPDADVRQAGELEQALHRAVFAVGTVQQREHDVGVGPARVMLGTGTSSPSTVNAAGNASRPDASICCASSASSQRPSVVIADGHDVVLRRVERAGDRDRGGPGHVVLGRLAPEQQHDSRRAVTGSFWLKPPGAPRGSRVP